MKKAAVNKEFYGVLALFTLVTIYGFIGYFSRELAPGLTVFQQLYVRLLLATPLLWLTFYKRISVRKCIGLIKHEPLLILLRAVCLYILSIPLYFYAVQHAKLANVGFLQILPFTFILGSVINKEPLTKIKLALVSISLFGAYLLTVKSGLDFSTLGKGELASIISAFLLSLGFVTRKRHKYKANNFEISLTIISVGALLVLLLSVMLGDGVPRTSLSWQRFWILLLLAAYLNSFIILLANVGFRRVRDTIANNIMALEGVFALIFGFLLYEEVPAFREVIGAIIILGAAIASAYFIKESSQ